MSHDVAYKYVNGVMDTIRIVLLQNDEVEIGGFGTFTVVTDLKGKCIAVFQAGQVMERLSHATHGK